MQKVITLNQDEVNQAIGQYLKQHPETPAFIESVRPVFHQVHFDPTTNTYEFYFFAMENEQKTAGVHSE